MCWISHVGEDPHFGPETLMTRQSSLSAQINSIDSPVVGIRRSPSLVERNAWSRGDREQRDLIAVDVVHRQILDVAHRLGPRRRSPRANAGYVSASVVS